MLHDTWLCATVLMPPPPAQRIAATPVGLPFLCALLLPLLQMAALTCLLLTKDGAQGQLGMVAAAAGPPLLAVASYLTAHSLALYVAGLWRFMK